MPNLSCENGLAGIIVYNTSHFDSTVNCNTSTMQKNLKSWLKSKDDSDTQMCQNTDLDEETQETVSQQM